MRAYIVQDRWCELCSRPAALLIFTVGKPGLIPVCSEEHGQIIIEKLQAEGD